MTASQPDETNWEQGLEHAATSNVGLRRANNQDSYAVSLAGNRDFWLERGHVFLVADGMGAHAAGELASKMAADFIPLSYQKLVQQPPHEALRRAIENANEQIHRRGQESEDFRGMGTTCSVLVLLPQGAMVGQVGDSRVYRLRGIELEQLTFDHSLAWEMRAIGQLAGGIDPALVPKNIITRSLGPNATVQVDIEGPFPLAVGDTFLLCSDGLSGQVTDDEIGTVLMTLSPAEAVQTLVDLANLRGGPDNITVIVVRVAGREMTRAGVADEGTRPSGSPPSRPVHPVIWVLLLALAIASLGAWVLGQHLIAIFALAGAILVGMVALVRRNREEDSGLAAGTRPLGQAPYVRTKCAPGDGIVARFSDLLRQLTDAAQRDDWVVDWSRVRSQEQQVARAREAGQFAEAARYVLLAISFLMSQLRHQSPSLHNGDSGGVSGA